MSILKYYYSYNYLLLYIFIHLVICNIMMLLFGVVSYKVRPPRLVSYACLYTTDPFWLLGSTTDLDTSGF